MPELFIYLIKVNAALGLFFLVYYFLLRRLTFYRLNRYYLLFALVFSATYPVLKLETWFMNTSQLPEAVFTFVPDWEQVAAPSAWTFWSFAVVAFWVMVGLFLLRLALRFYSLWRIHQASVASQWQYFSFRHVLQSIQPFSFWKNIYVHVEGHEEQELTDIFQHELVHVRELHTVDTLLAEGMCILCWMNPAAWLMRIAVRENLEYITDQRVLKSGVDKRAYQFSLLQFGIQSLEQAGQRSLLDVGAGAGIGSNLRASQRLSAAMEVAPDPASIANHFNLHHLKNRIRMMNTARSSSFHLGKYFILIPVLVSSAIIFALSRSSVESEEILESMGFSATETKPELPDSPTDHASMESVTQGVGENGRMVAGGNGRMDADGIRTVQGKDARETSGTSVTEENRTVVLTGKKIAIAGDASGQAGTRIRIAKAPAPEQTKETTTTEKRVVFVAQKVTGSTQNSAADTAGTVVVKAVKINGTAVQNVNEIIIEKAGEKSGEVAAEKLNDKAGERLNDKAGEKSSEGSNAPVTVIGRPMRVDSNSTRVLIREGVSVKGTEEASNEAPLVIIDGEVGDISQVDPSIIESIHVIKGHQITIQQYGELAKFGTIKIYTKKI